jgi:DNA adenine methylase
MAKPFLKWAGGKAKLAPKIAELLPEELGVYHEPFLGGGAVFLHLAENKLINRFSLSDQCRDLIRCWQMLAIKGGVEDLLPTLGRMNHPIWSRELYDELRGWDRDPNWHKNGSYTCHTSDQKVARFLLLNKLGFNGVCRYNSRGEFNVPWGKRTTYKMPEESYLMDIHKLLRGRTAIRCWDYKTALQTAQPGDFAYLDPPYVPLSKAGFTSYSGAWGEKQQQELFAELQRLDKLGVRWMLSGHDEPTYRALYSSDNFRVLDITEIYVRRSVAANGDRPKVKELIIRNYI